MCSDIKRTSVYRLTASSVEQVQVKPKYLETSGFSDTDVEIDDVQCRLIYGHMATNRAKWTDALAVATNTKMTLSNTAAAAVLLVPAGQAVFALSYGMGHHLLDPTVIEPGFGLQYAARVLDADALKSITQHTMDKRARIDRRSIPAGANALEFGMADLGIAVSRVLGQVKSDDGTRYSVKGADSVSMPIRHRPEQLVKDLRSISVILDQEIEDSDMRMLTRMSPLGSKDPRKHDLNKHLNEALQNGDDERLGTAWPWEHADEFNATDSLTVRATAGQVRHFKSLSIQDLQQIVKESPAKDPLKLLKKYKVLLHPDEEGEDIASPAISANKWIAYETHLGDTLFFYHDGRWFSMHRRYSEEVNERCAQALEGSSHLEFIPWQRSQNKDSHWDEQRYNQQLADADSGFLLMDRKLVPTQLHRRGFEACDLLGPGDELVHVKRLDRSTDASHLFNQALVSAETLKIDGHGMEMFRKAVERASGDQRTAPDQVRKVVIGIAGRHPLKTDKLFTFSRVTLLRLVENLRSRGIDVYIESIRDSIVD